MSEADRRGEYRLPARHAFFLELESASPDGRLPPVIVACHSVDISANGVQLTVDEAVVHGSILRLGFDPGPAGSVMYLVGEVRWCRPVDGGYAVGFGLYDSDHTDIAGWKQMVAARLGAA